MPISNLTDAKCIVLLIDIQTQILQANSVYPKQVPYLQMSRLRVSKLQWVIKTTDMQTGLYCSELHLKNIKYETTGKAFILCFGITESLCSHSETRALRKACALGRDKCSTCQFWSFFQNLFKLILR